MSKVEFYHFIRPVVHALCNGDGKTAERWIDDATRLLNSKLI